MASTRKEIIEVLRAERARGTKKVVPDTETLKARAEYEKTMLDYLLSIEDRRDFVRLLTNRFGLPVGSKRYNRAVDAWDNCQRKHVRKKPLR